MSEEETKAYKNKNFWGELFLMLVIMSLIIAAMYEQPDIGLLILLEIIVFVTWGFLLANTEMLVALLVGVFIMTSYIQFVVREKPLFYHEYN